MIRGEFDKAKKLLEQCARLMPHNCAIYLNEAELYIKTGDGDRARVILQIIEREGQDGETLARAAKLYFDLGDLARAKSLVERALKASPGNRFAIAVESLLGTEKTPREESR
jgi:tetratricopeptide (TPR) repeat protein